MDKGSHYYSQHRRDGWHGVSKCPFCGSRQRIDAQESAFLSGNSPRQENLVHLQDGEILMDRFKIVRFIGNGRFGSVYLAEDTLRSEGVALKVAAVGPLDEDVAPKQLKRELEVHNTISRHDNVIRVHDLHFAPKGGAGLLILSMEYADGGTFRKWLLEHSQNLEARQTIGLDYVMQACRGLVAVHDAKAVHLDVKPENLLFSGEALKVSDFGISRYRQMFTQSPISSWIESSIDSGTPAYMSPEHFSVPHPDDLDGRADIYSLGIILFELLHPKCRPPFGGSEARLKELQLNVPAPRLPETDENLAGIVAICLEKAPADRYQSVRELLNDLEKGICSNIEPAVSDNVRTTEVTERVDEIWHKASLYFSEGDFNEATRLTAEVLALNPGHVQAQHMRDELRSKFEQADKFYREIEQSLETGGLTDLLELLKEVVSIYPDHPSGSFIQTKLGARAKEFREAMEKGFAALVGMSWESALEWLQKAQRLDPGYSDLAQLVDTLSQIRDLRRGIDRALLEEQYGEAEQLAYFADLLVSKMEDEIPALREARGHDVA